MTTEQIVAVQRRIGTTPDGLWGSKSRAACKAHLQSLMPKPNLWPAENDAAMAEFYGKPGDESELRAIDVTGLGIEFFGTPIRRISCHRKVGDSLLKILQEIAQGPNRGILKNYAGVYNPRPMRGSKTGRPSKHAWGAAIDLDPTPNGLNAPWPTKATMPIEVAEVFAKHGWKSAGPFWGRDAMHHEATK
jgi:hypothetical protein